MQKTTTTVTTRTTKTNKTQYGRNKHEQSMNYFLQLVRSLMIMGFQNSVALPHHDRIAYFIDNKNKTFSYKNTVYIFR